jgi:hypothetical protein
MRRTTVRLDEKLLRDAKAAAAAAGQTLTRLLEESLRERLARQSSQGRPRRVRLPTSGRGGLQPGVDLDDNVALRDTLDDEVPLGKRR